MLGKISLTSSPMGRELKLRMEEWIETAVRGHAASDPRYVRTVCEEIVRRSQIISETGPLSFFKIAYFLLERTEAWMITGMPINQIGLRLPKNMSELGELKLAEGSDRIYGMPLTTKELQNVADHFNGKIRRH